MTQYSDHLIFTAAEMLKAAIKELGEEAGAERANAMMDAFDPDLKGQLLIRMLMGPVGDAITLRIIRHDGRNKLQAIKAVRWLTGLGLREAKELVEEADYVGVSKIEGSFTADQRVEFATHLKNTGYDIA